MKIQTLTPNRPEFKTREEFLQFQVNKYARIYNNSKGSWKTHALKEYHAHNDELQKLLKKA